MELINREQQISYNKLHLSSFEFKQVPQDLAPLAVLLCHGATNSVNLLAEFQYGWCKFFVEPSSEFSKFLFVDFAPAKSIIALS